MAQLGSMLASIIFAALLPAVKISHTRMQRAGAAFLPVQKLSKSMQASHSAKPALEHSITLISLHAVRYQWLHGRH